MDATSNGVVWIEYVERLSVSAAGAPLHVRQRARSGSRWATIPTRISAAHSSPRAADAVLLSRGEVSLRAALAAANVMHERLARGDSPAEALRRARVALSADPTLYPAFRRALMRVDGWGCARYSSRRSISAPSPRAGCPARADVGGSSAPSSSRRLQCSR
jgi:hypothetical protein